MTEPKENELKPCPWCGTIPRMSIYSHWSGCCITDEEEWNNAYCWKEIERLKKENEYFRQKLEMWEKLVDTLKLKLVDKTNG